VDEWWDVAQRQLPLEPQIVSEYRAALLERFGNPRMRDQLSRIAADGSQKIPIRIVPALVADRKAGNSPLGAERAVAAWILHLRGRGAPFNDAKADKIADLRTGTLEDSVRKTCEFLEIENRDSSASILALAQQLDAL
jgi:fructuronate reductase